MGVSPNKLGEEDWPAIPPQTRRVKKAAGWVRGLIKENRRISNKE